MKSIPKLTTILTVVTLVMSFSLSAQPVERPEPSLDDIIAHLGLSDSQVVCLETNKQAFQDAVAPIAEQIRPLQRQLREAARNGEDTTAIQGEIDALRSSAEDLRGNYVATASSCLDANQGQALAELVAAETLQQEVRQGIGLLLFEPSGERTRQATAGARQRNRRGPRGGGRQSPPTN